MYKCDLSNKEYEVIDVPPSYVASGHSLLSMSNDFIISVGGILDSMFVYTTKLMQPSPCDLLQECKISDSPEISHIAWIQCELFCKRWLHQFCVNLLDKALPKSKYVCRDCKSKTQRKENVKEL